MSASSGNPFVSAFFLTFSGNCKEALTFYQSCFGGTLQFNYFEGLRAGANKPVVNGSLISDVISIHGSDLVHNEGRITGNHMAILISCTDLEVRRALVETLAFNKELDLVEKFDDKLIEVIDAFDIRWVLYV